MALKFCPIRSDRKEMRYIVDSYYCDDVCRKQYNKDYLECLGRKKDE
jgi:hypothetical protein